MLLERELTLGRFSLHYCRLLVADIDDGNLVAQPHAGMNHPAWVLGHLAMAFDFGVRLLTGNQGLDDGWYQQFGPGSKPTAERADYPSKEMLLAKIDETYARLEAAAQAATQEKLAKRQRLLFVEHLPTVGDLLAHLLTTHSCIHLGQLSAWRRTMGLGAVLGV